MKIADHDPGCDAAPTIDHAPLELQRTRQALRMSAQGSAETLGWSLAHFRDFERGAFDPRVTELQRVARVLGMEIRIQVVPAFAPLASCDCFTRAEEDEWSKFGLDETGHPLAPNPYCALHFGAAPLVHEGEESDPDEIAEGEPEGEDCQ
ncbi:helix-turn-helix domain-containing protein [Humidisolicoccus flavus]|uniref:helix-turn-helix domain-containing protein n=1 Tax=Humidisolicoccus flavus TaxID=3111414 RepID=UPI003245F9C4